MKNYLVTECPGSGYPINIVNYFKKGVTTSWTHSKPHSKPDSLQYFLSHELLIFKLKVSIWFVTTVKRPHVLANIFFIKPTRVPLFYYKVLCPKLRDGKKMYVCRRKVCPYSHLSKTPCTKKPSHTVTDKWVYGRLY